MDLDRMKQPEREALCRRYFYFGLAGLPFLWAINTIWFGNLVFFKKNKVPTSRNGSPNAQRNDNERRGENSASNANENQIEQADIDLEFESSMKRIRCYVILSFIGTLFWIVLLGGWVFTYQINRALWGEFGDQISYNIPRGIP